MCVCVGGGGGGSLDFSVVCKYLKTHFIQVLHPLQRKYKLDYTDFKSL